MKIDVLDLTGRPSWQTGSVNLHAALKPEVTSWPVELAAVQDDADAQRRRCLGSPSFQLHGDALWSQDCQEYIISCRKYPTPAGLRGWSTVETTKVGLHTLAGSTS